MIVTTNGIARTPSKFSQSHNVLPENPALSIIPFFFFRKRSSFSWSLAADGGSQSLISLAVCLLSILSWWFSSIQFLIPVGNGTSSFFALLYLKNNRREAALFAKRVPTLPKGGTRYF